MHNLFRLDNPLIQLLFRLGDLIIANLLFLVCSVPVVTLGASAAALCKVTQDLILDQESGIIKTFFRAFRDNFKQATIAWLVILLILAGVAADLLLISAYFTGGLATLLRGLILVLTVIVLSVACYLFPLMVRYSNTLREHIKNAMILSVVKLLRTVVLLFITTFPFWIAYFSMIIFVNTLTFWLILGFALASFLCSSLLVPVFKELEKNSGADVKILK